jgi:hypothetical protein
MVHGVLADRGHRYPTNLTRPGGNPNRPPRSLPVPLVHLVWNVGTRDLPLRPRRRVGRGTPGGLAKKRSKALKRTLPGAMRLRGTQKVTAGKRRTALTCRNVLSGRHGQDAAGSPVARTSHPSGP